MAAVCAEPGKKSAGGGLLACLLREAQKNARQTAKYLDRYLKKLPVTGSRPEHYDGGSRITLRFFNHRTPDRALRTPAAGTAWADKAYSGEALQKDTVLWLSGKPDGGRVAAESEKGAGSGRNADSAKSNVLVAESGLVRPAGVHFVRRQDGLSACGEGPVGGRAG